MATTVQDFGESSEKTVFSESSEDDIAYANRFWQSVQLLPPMESRLVSSNVRQRMKAAPPGHQPINVTYPGNDDPPQLQKFHSAAYHMQLSDAAEKVSHLNAFKEEDKALFAQQREARKQKEKLSRNKGLPVRRDPLPLPIEPDDEDDSDYIRQTTLQDLDKFEEKLGQGDFHRDTDSD